MIKPSSLISGDRVAVVAPAGLIMRERTESAIEHIRGWGLEPVRGEHLYYSHGIFAGTDEQRLSDLQSAFDDKEIKAVFCARGGYGLSRIIDSIDFSGIKEYPKWVIGFSDITVLHLWMNCLQNICSVHGEMMLNFMSRKKSPESFSSLKDILFGRQLIYNWRPSLVRTGNAEAVLAGGNLSLIYNLMGNAALREALKDKILFIEETSEYFYALDRMMMGLKLSGILSSIKGLIVGGLSEIKESNIPYGISSEEIIMDAVKEYDYPVVFDFPAGHIPDNRAVLLGSAVRLQADSEQASMTYKNLKDQKG